MLNFETLNGIFVLLMQILIFMQKKLFREYNTINPQENHWGIRIKNAGYTHVLPGEEYPDHEHPNEYYFTWNRGRVLQEYQLILITQGKGEFESATCRRKAVQSGNVLLLFKNEWHRYRPLKETGWQEYWIGFDGEYAEHIFSGSSFSTTQPVLTVGEDEMISGIVFKVFEWLENQVTGHEKVVASYIPVILAKLETLIRQKPLSGKNAESKVKKYQLALQERFYKNPDLEATALELGVSYSWIRKIFKRFIGISPNQYVLKLKLQKARDMLVLSHKPVKLVALECGFSSPYYFSRYFKEECGMAPREYRNGRRGTTELFQ